MKSLLSVMITLVFVAAIGLAGASCLPAGQPSTPAPTPAPAPVTPSAGVPGTGTMEVHITDAPSRDEVTSILVTVSKVEIHKAVAEQEQEQQQPAEGEQIQEQEQENQQVQEGEGEWLPLNIIDDANPFDLLQIRGLDKVFAISEVEIGKYTQIRLTIDKVEVGLAGKDPQEATVPSGELKFVRPFDIVADETTVILLDFDAEKSVTITGTGQIIVKPVVKLTVEQG